MLAGENVYWPTREKLYVFDQRTAEPLKAIDLAARGATGGNVLIVHGRLFLATEKEMIAMGAHGGVETGIKSNRGNY